MYTYGILLKSNIQIKMVQHLKLKILYITVDNSDSPNKKNLFLRPKTQTVNKTITKQIRDDDHVLF